MDMIIEWLRSHRWLVLGITAVLFVLVLIQRMGRAIRRRRKPAPLHPKLQAYAGRTEMEREAEVRDAAQIIATSSTGTVAGYEIVRQIEAVFVEGYRTPQEAVTALKAVASRRGANAIINLSQQRTAAGRSTAQGDAVMIHPSLNSHRANDPEKKNDKDSGRRK